VAGAARAQEPDDEPGSKRGGFPPVRGPTLNPALRDRVPMLKDKGALIPGGQPARGSVPPPRVAPTPPQGGQPPPAPQPVAAPAPTPTPPLPGATSLVSGQTRISAGPVDGSDADDKRRKSTGKFLFNYENANLIDIVKQISKMTGRNFILRENLKGQKLTILCEEPITSKEAYRAFLVALEINNLAMVPAGKFWKIEERKAATRQAIPTYFDGEAELPGDEAMVTTIYRLKYIELDQAQKLVDSMLNKTVGDLQIYQPNLLIMSDAAVNIARVKKLLDRVDQPGFQSRIQMLDIKYAPAADIANKLTTLLDPNKNAQKKNAVPADGAQPKPPMDPKSGPQDTNLDDYYVTKIVPDERTNKIIVVSTPESFLRIKQLVEMLDVPEGATSSPQVHVHNLENADSEKLTAALNNLAQAGKKAGDKKKGPAQETDSMFEGEVKVTADPPTNSLVVVASQRDYRNLLKVIKRLDVRRPQVFVEAVIMEVTLNRTRDLALDWFSGVPATVPGMGGGLGVIANPGGQARVVKMLNPADPTGGLSALLGFLAFKGPSNTVQVGNNKIDLPSFGAVLNALEADGNVDVLSTPHILTTDNVKAEILVGQTVPFAAGFTSNLGGGTIGSFAPIVSVQRQDVALKFIVTPHVNTSNFVRLEMDQEVSDLGDSVEVSAGQKQPTTTKRTAKTTVVVKDEQTVIIGGLISDKKILSESKVPVLGDIPWLGFLFRSSREEFRKTNLLIIMTPHIIRADEDFRRIYERKLRERQEFMEAFYGVYAPAAGPVDYERKQGPYGAMHLRLKEEMMRVENGGPGLPGESIIGVDEDKMDPPTGPRIKPVDDGKPDDTPPQGAPPAGAAAPPPGAAPPSVTGRDPALLAPLQPTQPQIPPPPPPEAQ
jgi:general secretion pathway protein D